MSYQICLIVRESNQMCQTTIIGFESYVQADSAFNTLLEDMEKFKRINFGFNYLLSRLF